MLAPTLNEVRGYEVIFAVLLQRLALEMLRKPLEMCHNNEI